MPPPEPLHAHDHGPEPDTAVAEPVPQSPDDGAAVTPTPLAPPHEPLMIAPALQEAVVPEFIPVHDHVHGPVPDTAVALPAEHNPVEGAEATFVL